MKIYLIRHADPDYANDTLTERGHTEARALVNYLRREEIDEIVCSPLGRARATAGHSSRALDLDMRIEPWLAEIELRLGTDDRRSVWDVSPHRFRTSQYLQNPAELERIPELPIELVRNTVNDVRRNSDRFLAGYGYVRENGAYRVEAPNSLNVAVFAHGGFGLTWLAVLLEIPVPFLWGGFQLLTSSVTQIVFDRCDGGLATPRCLMMGALPHIYTAGLVPGMAGLRAEHT